MSAEGSPGADWLVGQVIGNYRILASIGQGGMGSVYFATHEVLGRHAAVKVLLPEFTGNAELVARFFREARATSQLRHRAFVEIFDSGRLGDGSAYLVMEYLRGESLAGYLRRLGPLPVDDALAIAHDIAEGVGFAHGHGIVHRDLKPDNVFLSVQPGGNDGPAGAAVKVLDFGIAKLMGESDRKEPAQTRAGALLGTPLYMAPEQCRGAGQIDQRADLYAFGCIVHEMLTGLPPFPLEGFGEIIAAQLAAPPPPLRTLRPELPQAVEALVLSMLAKKPSDRPPDMAAIAAAIDAIRSELASRPGGAPGATKSVSRLPVLVPELPSADLLGPPQLPPFPLRAPSGSAPSPALARTTPMVAEEPRREISAGGTQLLPTPADAAGAGSRSGSGSARRGPARAVPSISTLGTGVGEVHGGFNPRRGAGRGHTKAILAAFLIGGAGVAAAVVKLTAPPASLLGSASRARAEAPPSDPIAAPRPEPPPPAPALAPPPAARAPRKAAQPETVRVRIDSDPTGASLVDARTGDTIGRTPFLRELPRASQPFTLSVRKGSYRSKQVSLDLQHDTELDIKLEHKPAGGAAKPGDDDYRKL